MAFLVPGPALCAEVVLTDLERYYVETEGDLTLCVDPDWVPFEKLDERGQYTGIAADLLRLVAERTGIRLHLVPTTDWDQSLAFSQERRCQALGFLNETPQRRQWLTFSEPIFTDPNVFITREEHPFISDPGGLENETLVLPKGTSVEEFLRKDYPNIRIRVVDTEAEALRLVSEHKADMTLRSLIIAAYTIKKEGWFNLKIAGQLPGHDNNLRVGVIRDKRMLLDALNKGIRSISATDRGAIVNRHVSINVQTVPDYVLLAKVSASLVAAMVLALVWVWQLRRHNRELTRISQTDTLTGLANRTRLNTALQQEFARFLRSGRPFSLLLVDLDHFKRINDELGHLAGDEVLREFAALVRSQVRETDMPSRWGGEEFLILCPETGLDNALVLAGRIVAAVAGHGFSCRRGLTVSVGVAVIQTGDTPDALLARADEALYRAKDTGRNRACPQAAPAAESASG